MAIVEVKVPQLSESVAEATLLQWKKKPGEAVALDEILVEIEKRHIRNVLDTTRWRIEGGGGAAQLLGLKPSTLRSRMLKLGISRPR